MQTARGVRAWQGEEGTCPGKGVTAELDWSHRGETNQIKKCITVWATIFTAEEGNYKPAKEENCRSHWSWALRCELDGFQYRYTRSCRCKRVHLHVTGALRYTHPTVPSAWEVQKQCYSYSNEHTQCPAPVLRIPFFPRRKQGSLRSNCDTKTKVSLEYHVTPWSKEMQLMGVVQKDTATLNGILLIKLGMKGTSNK